MINLNSTLVFTLALLSASFCVTATVWGQGVEARQARQKAQQLMQQGNFKEAYEVFEKLCTSPEADAKLVSDDLTNAINCLNRLGNQKMFDELVEKSVKAHADNWRLLQTAARQYMSVPHYGFIVSGEFERGGRRGGGQMANSQERDRIRALQLMMQAQPLVLQQEDQERIASFYEDLANQLFYYRGYYESWRLQYKSDLSTLPDYDDGFPYSRGGQGAAVDEEGNPIYYAIASDWDNALNDGERWRYCLDQIVKYQPSKQNYVRQQIATFARNQFGVTTMQGGIWPAMVRHSEEDSNQKDESGVYAIHTLGADETIAKLASGVKRFELPEDYNFIRIYEAIVENPETGYAENALTQLAQIHEDRRQYVKATEYWRQNIEKYGPGNRGWKQQRLDQIVKNWGRFEGSASQPAGQPALLEYRFRNGKQVSLKAERIDLDALIKDAIDHINASSERLDWRKINISNIGYWLINEGGGEYIKETVATWEQDLQPRDNHVDDRVTLTTPLKAAGAYLVTAEMDDGNTSKIVVWVADTVIVRKPLSGKSLIYVADAVTGQPIANAKLSFFGYRQEYRPKTVNGRRVNSYNIVTKDFQRQTDEQGQVIVPQSELDQNFQWLIQATTDGGRHAFYGFQGIFHSRIHDEVYNQVKTFVVTDRPVYRPQQSVKFKIWTRHAQYDKEDVSQFAGQPISYKILNPKGEALVSRELTANEYGGVEGEFAVPSDAMLGQYTIQCNQGAIGGNTFRVEEYKKPEFEVSIEAPQEPVKLGDRIQAKIKANYFFGAPVSNATVKYTITRQEYDDQWFPIAEWDWCYGPGYWWFGYDTPWFPRFREWRGCFGPFPWWYPRNPAPPEIVAEREVQINPDGIVEFEIDTQLAKELHGDQNHRYQITAEVRDASRRTIVGSGEVLVAQQPFKVFSWLDRGYYKSGDVVEAHFKAQTLDKQPVVGKGRLKLLKISYDKEQQPVEQEVASWELDTDAAGEATQQLKPNQPGQYRLSYIVTDSKENEIEGGYVFTVIGDRFDSAEYRFNELELIPEKRDYQPGDSVKLQVNSNQADATILLFIKPSNGVYLPPQLIKLEGKSTVVEIPVSKKDMPNFYIEALTVAEGNVFNETKEIVVPPEKRILNVEVTPSSENYRPGEKAKVKVHVTDHTGENFVGDLAITVYDKAVEYISGGSNTPDIKEFFWKWRRRHNPQQFDSLQDYSPNLVIRGEQAMNDLGIFGGGIVEDLATTTADDLGNHAIQKSLGMARRRGQTFTRSARAMDGAGFGGGGMAPGSLEAPAAAMEMSAAPAEKGAMAADAAQGMAGPGGAEQPLVQPQVRSNFADTALWIGNLQTNSNGIAEIELDMPENLTTWKINVFGVGHGTRVGNGSAEVITRKDLLVRLQAPRFFVQKDEVTLSAVVNNYLPTAKDVRVGLEIDGPQIKALDSPTTNVTIQPDGEARVDWNCQVVQPGEVTIRMLALTDEESDAMEMKFPVKVHGFLKIESFAGTVRPGQDSSWVNLNVPADRQPEQTRLEVRYSPSLAMAMIDSLPYLNDYPHGCTEQTLNRWLPSLMTQKMLIDMGVDLEDVANKKTNLNAQEIGDDRERARQWQRKNLNPVWSKQEVDNMVVSGLDQLAAMQNSDGGWGWFSGWGERSFPHTTAVVVHGLQVARANDQSLEGGILEKGINWLRQFQKEQLQLIKNFGLEVSPNKASADNLDALVYMILAEEGIDNVEMRDFLYRDRNNLSVYAKAVFGLGLQARGEREKLTMVLRNINQYVVQDDENETAYIKNPEQGYWYYWYGSETEANAYYLKLLSRVEPQGKTAPRLVKYLLNNRKHATYWNSTRDTALVVEAFAEYITATGENRPDMTVEIRLDGELKKEVQITAGNLFTFDNQFLVTGSDLTDGEHKIEIRRKGNGPVYWNTYLTNFSTEDYITAAGLEVKIDRKFYRLTPVDKTIPVRGARGQAVDQKVEKYERTELEDLSTLQSGELVEVELTVVSKNDYEYLVMEDFKPAGFEAVEVRSGYTETGLRAYTEFRDDRVNFYVQQLARGNHSLSYRLRAEVPGRFSALPARIEAMYAPELTGNSNEIKLKVVDEE